jgi:hypothetical protein
MDENGDFLVAWPATRRGSLQIFARRYDSTGAPETLFRVNSTRPPRQGRPASVAMNDSGEALIVWDAAGSQGAFGQRFVDAGNRVGVEFAAFSRAGRSFPSVAMAADGRFVVAGEYATFSSTPNNYGYAPSTRSTSYVVSQRFDWTGYPFALEHPDGKTLVCTSHCRPNPTRRSSAVAMNGDGRYVVAWRSQARGASGVFALRREIGGGGTLLWVVSTSGEGPHLAPGVAVGARGDAFLAWTQGGRLLGRFYEPSGLPQGGVIRVSTGKAVGYPPSVAIAANESAVVVWSGASEGVNGIFGQRYAAAIAHATDGER